MLNLESDLYGLNCYDDGSRCECCPFGCHIDVDFVPYTKKMLSMDCSVERLQELKDRVKAEQRGLIQAGSMSRQQIATRDTGCAVKPICKDVGVSTVTEEPIPVTTRTIGVMAELPDVSTSDNLEITEEFDESPFTPDSPRSSEPFLENDDERIESLSSPESLPPPQEPREKIIFTNEYLDALKVLDDALVRGKTTKLVTCAVNVILHDWLQVAGEKTSNPFDVEDYLNCFTSYSPDLLRYIVNMPDGSGNSALHYAISHDNFDVVSLLLNTNICDTNKSNKAGYTSVMLVSLSKINSEAHKQVVRKLLSLSDVNKRAAQHSQTALILATSHGRIDTVKLLIEAGADLNVQDEDGSTALICAAEHGHGDIVKYLLEQEDCDSSIVDSDNCTALRVAMDAGHKDVGVMLYAHMHFLKPKSSTLLARRSRSLTPSTSYMSSSPALAKKQNSSVNYARMSGTNIEPW